MSKKIPLYVLLVFLIVVNGFFLYNYLGAGANSSAKEPMRPKQFLTKELGLNESQKAEFDVLDAKHYEEMKGIEEGIRVLKDKMFNGFTDADFEEENITALTRLIGEKEAAKDLEIFRYFRKIKALCNDEQKAKFNTILKDALRPNDRGQGPPLKGGPDGRPEGRPEGDRPPPPMDGDRKGPPRDGEHTPPPNR